MSRGDEFFLLRALLEETQQELGIIFEQGFSLGSRQDEALGALCRRMGEYGLSTGADLGTAFCQSLAASRLDTGWSPQEAAFRYAALWKYIGLCLRRLEFLEAKASLQPEEA